MTGEARRNNWRGRCGLRWPQVAGRQACSPPAAAGGPPAGADVGVVGMGRCVNHDDKTCKKILEIRFVVIPFRIFYGIIFRMVF